MFQGVVHHNARKILARYATDLPDQVHVIGSGNFSIETTLRLNGYQGVITSCDVSLYTCALGAYFTDQTLQVILNRSQFPELALLEPYLHEPESIAAVVVFSLQTFLAHK